MRTLRQVRDPGKDRRVGNPFPCKMGGKDRGHPEAVDPRDYPVVELGRLTELRSEHDV